MSSTIQAERLSSSGELSPGQPRLAAASIAKSSPAAPPTPTLPARGRERWSVARGERWVRSNGSRINGLWMCQWPMDARQWGGMGGMRRDANSILLPPCGGGWGRGCRGGGASEVAGTSPTEQLPQHVVHRLAVPRGRGRRVALPRSGRGGGRLRGHIAALTQSLLQQIAQGFAELAPSGSEVLSPPASDPPPRSPPSAPPLPNRPCPFP